MNFLLRPAASPHLDPPQVSDVTSSHKSTATLEGLIAEDDFRHSVAAERDNGENGASSVVNETVSSQNPAKSFPFGKHTNVASDEGWIIIPCKEIPENWRDTESVLSFLSVDRSFVFPGEHLHILVCLSAAEQDLEVITPFKVAAVMSKNGFVGPHAEHKAVNQESETNSTFENDGENPTENGESLPSPKEFDAKRYISESESILRTESLKQQTRNLLERLKNSHFFVRLVDCNEESVSTSNAAGSPVVNDATGKSSVASEAKPKSVTGKYSHLNAVVDKGNFDASAAGGIARNVIGCASLSNGDIVVLLQLNIGNNVCKYPVLEVLQFEKHENKIDIDLTGDHKTLSNNQVDPCGDLLKWLLPLDRSLPLPARPLSPPNLSSSSAMIGSTSQRSNYSPSTGSQLFSFGNFRSYSMSSVPQSMTTAPLSSSYAKPSFDFENWDRYSANGNVRKEEIGNDGLLSFRGVTIEQDRFSSLCGLEGIYLPGRRWTKRVEIVQPLAIHSFSADCNSEDFLCVQIKNVSPAHTPDIIVYLDAITIVYEEAPNSELLQSLPITCTEAGNDQCLPNIPLKRGEEHSFIIKPAIITDRRAHHERSNNAQYSLPSSTINPNSMNQNYDLKMISSSTGHYAVLVSCRCNYTESKLFFKQSTSWRPRVSRDLMISVASKMSEPTLSPSGGICQLPVQVLTLQATNLTHEDLTLTVLAPASFTSPPSVVSVNPVPSTPKGINVNATPLSSEVEQDGATGEQVPTSSDLVPATSLSCSHLWLQSTVPLGCVPSLSTATVKLELLPLTNGIITLDTLQISVKEKGVTYIPEHSLKIFATSSIVAGSV